MLCLQEYKTQGIPFMTVEDNSLGHKKVVVIFHKLLNNKRDELPTALELANHGFYVVLIDMEGHGARRKCDAREEWYDLNHIFQDLDTTAGDLDQVVSFLRMLEGDRLELTKLTVGGVSIGASAALLSSNKFSYVHRVACLIGSYHWEYIVKYNALRLFERYLRQPIQQEVLAQEARRYNYFEHFSGNFPEVLFLHGTMDTSLPQWAIEDFYGRLLTLYQKSGKEDRLQLKYYPKAGHQVTRAMLYDLTAWCLNNTNTVKTDREDKNESIRLGN